jgi:hypothetical protein
MFPIPFRRTELFSIVPPHEFLARLAAITSTRQPWFRSLAGEYEFVGRVTPDGFRITPVIRGRNTYLPRVTGTLRRVGVRTEIHVEQTLHPAAFIVVAVIFGFILSVALRTGDWKSVAGILILLFIVHSVMYVIGFLPDATRVEERLSTLAAPLLFP